MWPLQSSKAQTCWKTQTLMCDLSKIIEECWLELMRTREEKVGVILCRIDLTSLKRNQQHYLSTQSQFPGRRTIWPDCQLLFSLQWHHPATTNYFVTVHPFLILLPPSFIPQTDLTNTTKPQLFCRNSRRIWTLAIASSVRGKKPDCLHQPFGLQTKQTSLADCRGLTTSDASTAHRCKGCVSPQSL